jgi:hypothetical protein
MDVVLLLLDEVLYYIKEKRFWLQNLYTVC